LVIIAAGMSLLVAPTVASARHHHRRHHARSHVHHRRVRREHFGADGRAPGAQPSTAEPTAGTIVSITNGVLTIRLNGGATVSGMITDATEIQCRGEGSMSFHADDQSGSGGDSASQGDQGDQGGAADDQGHLGEGVGHTCASTALTADATVESAELTISSGGAVWGEVELAG
jgi:hypothetical protein